MRRFLIIGLATLALAACQTPSANVTPAPADTGVVSEVQNAATQICGFVPAASTVLGIVGGLTGYGSVTELVSNVASGICSAVQPPKAMRGRSTGGDAAYGVYRGVALKGHYVAR